MYKHVTFMFPFYYREMYYARDQQIEEYEKDGTIPDHVSTSLGNDNAAKAQWLRDREFDIETDKDLEKKRADLAQKDVAEMNQTATKASFWGKGGVFAGSIAGATVDADLVIYPLAGWKLIGTSAKLLPTMAKSAAWASGIETVRAKVTQENAYKLRQPKDTKEILQNIGYAAAGDMFFTAAGAIPAAVVSKQLKKLNADDSLDPITRSQTHNAIREMDSGVAESAEEIIDSVEARAQEYERPNFATKVEEPEPVVKPEPEEGVTTHPVDEKYSFLSEEDKVFLKENEAVVDELSTKVDADSYDSWINCATNNGIQI